MFDIFGLHQHANKRINELSGGWKRRINLAVALIHNPDLLILDEPTASLDEKGKNILFALIRRSIASGLGVIYISHNLGEIFEVCDRVTVFKDGRLVSTAAVRETDMGSIVRQMIGRSSSSLYARTRACLAENCPTVLEVDGYARTGTVRDVSFGVRSGEIFGIAGLVGAGRTELARMIFGLDGDDADKARLVQPEKIEEGAVLAERIVIGGVVQRGLVVSRKNEEPRADLPLEPQPPLFVGVGLEHEIYLSGPENPLAFRMADWGR